MRNIIWPYLYITDITLSHTDPVKKRRFFYKVQNSNPESKTAGWWCWKHLPCICVSLALHHPDLPGIIWLIWTRTSNFLTLVWLKCCVQDSSFSSQDESLHDWETNSKECFLNLQQLSNSLLLRLSLNHSKLSLHKQNFLFLISQHIRTLKLVWFSQSFDWLSPLGYLATFIKLIGLRKVP